MPAAPAPLGERLRFCMSLGWFSFAFAELTCSSTPSLFWPVFESFWSLGITWPLYMSHAVVLLTVLVRLRARVGSSTTPPVTLWLAGMVFGLYESWITKVLFRPTFTGFPGCGQASSNHSKPYASDNITDLSAYCDRMHNRTEWMPLPGAPMQQLEDPACGLYFGGVAAPQFSTLVFYYHPMWSFVIPCLVCERLLCRPLPVRGDGGQHFVTVPAQWLPGVTAAWARLGDYLCAAKSARCCAKAACGTMVGLFGALVLLSQHFMRANKLVDEVIVVTALALVVLVLPVVVAFFAALQPRKTKWQTIWMLFALYTGFSAGWVPTWPTY
jgi:hypothetical protein